MHIHTKFHKVYRKAKDGKTEFKVKWVVPNDSHRLKCGTQFIASSQPPNELTSHNTGTHTGKHTHTHIHTHIKLHKGYRKAKDGRTKFKVKWVISNDAHKPKCGTQFIASSQPPMN